MEIGTAILMSTGLALALVLMRGGGKSSMNLDQWWLGSTLTITDEQVDRLVCDCFRCISADGLILCPMYILTFDEDNGPLLMGFGPTTSILIFNVVTGASYRLDDSRSRIVIGFNHHGFTGEYCAEIRKNFRGVMLIVVIIGFIGMFSGLIFVLYCRYQRVPPRFYSWDCSCLWILITFEEVDMNFKNLVGYC